MPDPVALATAMAVAAATALAIAFFCGWPGRAARPAWLVDAGWVVGSAAGFFLGCWLLGVRPAYPFSQDLDRLLALILPVVLAVELVAVFPVVPRPIVWALRVIASAAVAPILLKGSSYLTDVAGPGTREWSPAWAAVVLAGLAAGLATVWALLARLARRAPGLSQAVCLAGTSAGAALSVMLSGYATGGQIGLPLAAALLGATLAALILPRSPCAAGPLGVGLVVLFSLLVIGRFFGDLSSAHAVLLFCAPLVGWLPELPYVRRLPAWARGLARVILAAVLVSAVVLDAQRRFVENSQSASPAEPGEASMQDYMDFGK